MGVGSLSGLAATSGTLPVIKPKTEEKTTTKPTTLGNAGVGLEQGLSEMPEMSVSIEVVSNTPSLEGVASLEVGDEVTRVNHDQHSTIQENDLNIAINISNGLVEGRDVARSFVENKDLSTQDFILLKKSLEQANDQMSALETALCSKGYQGSIDDKEQIIIFIDSLGADDDVKNKYKQLILVALENAKDYQEEATKAVAKAKLEAETNFVGNEAVQGAVNDMIENMSETFGEDILDKINQAYQEQKEIMENAQKALENSKIKSETSDTQNLMDRLNSIGNIENQATQNAETVEQVTNQATADQKELAQQNTMFNEVNLNQRMMYDLMMAA